jgi:hypothetical protein
MSIPKDRVHARHRLGSKALKIPENLWLEADIDETWMVAYRICQHAGSPVIGELRVFPRESDPDFPGEPDPFRKGGEWSATRLGLKATVPAGGISTRLVRKLRPVTDLAEGLRAANRYLKLFPEAVPRFKAAGFRRLTRRRPSTAAGRHGWSDEVLLDAALFYVQHTGRRTTVALADALKLKPTQARDLLMAAKRKGFLTAGIQGKASRRLTDLAKQLLEEREKR